MTDGLAYLAAIALALVFAYSAATKIRDSRATRRALDAAGVPSGATVARAIPLLELLAALALVIRPQLGAVIALALLAVFTGFVVYLLVRDIDVSCGCFGANSDESVSSVDVFRNGLLIALALIALTVQTPQAPAIEELIAATTALAIAGVVLGAVRTRRTLGQLFDNRLPGER